MPTDNCRVVDCFEPIVIKARRLCEKHYARFKRYGDPTFLVYREPAPKNCDEDTYIRHYGWIVGGDTNCWVWNGRRTTRGYGKGRRDTLIHRLAYETWVGPIPEGHVVRHKCDNPPCINPDHLETGTQADNSRDMVERGRMQDQRGARGPRARLTGEEVQDIRTEYAKGVLTQQMLAEVYGLTQSGVSTIVRGRTWKGV